MAGEGNKKNWNLYVLRYNYSGNYYVGTTTDHASRMEEHWKQTSSKSDIPIWSEKNKSNKGFKFYWLIIEKDGVEQGEAEHCEYALAKHLVQTINELKESNYEKFSEEHVGNASFVDINYCVQKIDVGVAIDEKIKEYLKNLKSLDTGSECFSVKCCRIGYVGEYDSSQSNKKWEDVELIEFSSNY